MEFSEMTPAELWDQHVEKLSSIPPKTETGLSGLNPKEFWDQHVKGLESLDSEREQVDASLESVKERRASPRIRSFNLTTYVPHREGRQDYIISIGRTLDVSEGGAKVETYRKLDIGSKLEMDIAIEDEIISAEGEVLHFQEFGDGLFGTGIHFTSINEEDRRLLLS